MCPASACELGHRMLFRARTDITYRCFLNMCRKAASALFRTERNGRISMHHLFSVCGLLCGQAQNAKDQAPKNVRKAKINPPFSTENSGFCGAAIQI